MLLLLNGSIGLKYLLLYMKGECKAMKTVLVFLYYGETFRSAIRATHRMGFTSLKSGVK